MSHGGGGGGVDQGGGGGGGGGSPGTTATPGKVAGTPIGGSVPGKPKITLGDIRIVGNLALDALLPTIRANGTGIRGCYERSLAAQPTIAGELVVTLKIGPVGAVVTASASGVHVEVESCIVSLFEKLRFPPPNDRATVEVKVPLTFQP